MTCPRCGSPVPAASTRCARCAAPVGVTVATGTLTPVPPAGADDALTSLPGVDVDAVSRRAEPLDTPPADHGETTGIPGIVRSRSDGGPLQAGQAFGSRYHIIRALGVGGMGAVYQAWDSEIGVAVAIKVIRPETMKDPRAAAEVERRFKRELLLARQVTHKNVVRIHDLGEIDRIKYITRRYVEGLELSTHLKREEKLSVEQILPIARSVVSGLIAAHAAGVVHRDLKPANIIISDEGDALIMDFGIARAAGGPPPALKADVAKTAARLGHMTRVVDATMIGVIVGTIEYMAPEQARGQAVDQRADIYAFGL